MSRHIPFGVAQPDHRRRAAVRWVGLVLCMLSWIGAYPAHTEAAELEPTRPFRNYKWGQHLASFGDMEVVHVSEIDDMTLHVYRKPEDDLSLGAGLLAASIEYIFLDERLSAIGITISTEIDLDSAGSEMRSISEEYRTALAAADSESTRRMLFDSLVWELYMTLQSSLSAEWGSPRQADWERTEWVQGNDVALLFRGGVQAGELRLPFLLLAINSPAFEQWLM